MKVYIAGSSQHLDLADRMHQLLTDCLYITLTSAWVESVRKVGAANPVDASFDDRARLANACLHGVAQCDVLWLLYPDHPVVSFGAALEFGAALTDTRITVVSGLDAKRSIFTSLADQVFCDAEPVEGNPLPEHLDEAGRRLLPHLLAADWIMRQASGVAQTRGRR